MITVEDAAVDDAAAMVADESAELAADRKVRAVQVIAALVADFLGSRYTYSQPGNSM